MTNNEIYLAILVMFSANLITRVIPFVFFTKKAPPKGIDFVAKYFPPIIIMILIFYTFGSTNFDIDAYGIKNLMAILATIILHIYFKNYLLSIFGGTVIYMVLIQLF